MLCLMDGRRTMRDIWEAAGRKSKDDPPTQDETIHLLAQLHTADLLQGEIPPDFDEMAERSEKAGQRRLMQRLRSPLALRVPLFDPDRMLNLTLPLVRPIFTVFGFLAWLALVLTGLVLAMLHWPELTSDVADRVLATENVALLDVRLSDGQEPARTRPCLRDQGLGRRSARSRRDAAGLHSGSLCRRVRFRRVPSETSPHHRRRGGHPGGDGARGDRASSSGSTPAPGLGRTVAFNVILIGGVSTLLFNGNPLLRFDGYYIFSDLIEIPNLATRGNAYLFYLIQKHLFKIDSVENPVTGPGEAKWLISYAVLSFIYRLIVSVGIALFLSARDALPSAS